MTAPTLTLLDAQAQLSLATEPFARWRAEAGEILVEFHRFGGGYRLRFLSRADFIVPADGQDVAGVPVPGTSETAVRDLFANQVVPMIRGQRGELAIHASASAVGGKALGFVAPTGRGKSTLAAALAQAGCPFLSDDGLYVTHEPPRYLAHPNRASFRLCHDSAATLGQDAGLEAGSREKSRVGANRSLPFQAGPLPLGRLYFLGQGNCENIAIEPMSRQAALAELLNHSFLLDIEDRERLQGQLARLADLVENVACFSFDYPRDFALLPQVVAAIRDHAEKA